METRGQSEQAGEAAETQHRVFLALWPDEATRKQLCHWSKALVGSGRPVPCAHLHLTLTFAGVVSADQVQCLQDRMAQLRFAPFTLRLDQLGHFARAKVWWLGSSEDSVPTANLAQQASSLCQACGIELSDRPFRPHVTLRRFVQTELPDTPVAPVYWSVDRVVLIESGSDGRPGPYRVLAEVRGG